MYISGPVSVFIYAYMYISTHMYVCITRLLKSTIKRSVTSRSNGESQEKLAHVHTYIRTYIHTYVSIYLYPTYDKLLSP